jgi:thiamine biosynthesis protein ThiI
LEDKKKRIQTLESLAVTDDEVSMPVFRPLIGFDKEDIMILARQIGTYETSILPYEDCCTVFVPNHPVTKPSVEALRESEKMADFEEPFRKAMAEREILFIR